jgi:hypothetical protein
MAVERNKMRFSKNLGTNPLTEMINSQKLDDKFKTEFINSIEKALFGEFNGG